MNDLTSILLGMTDNGPRERYLKLPFAWPGGKGEHLDKILKHIPYGEGYGEAFGGSGAVLLNRVPSKLDVFNDRYAGVTSFFRVVRDPVMYHHFMARIECTVHSREEFIWCKKTWKDCDDEVERAARWYYMVRYAINGKHNTTFGRSCNPVVTFADRLHKSLPLFGPIHNRLKVVQIENLDWRTCLNDYDRTGFVWYLDPTYLDSYPGTYEHELSVDDHRELIHRIKGLSGFVALSSYDTPVTREIYDVSGVWDNVISWNRSSTSLTQAFTDTNNLDKLETTSAREKIKELLWLKEFA